MYQVKLYSQRDERWKNDRLGFGSTTIGNYGCTISCVAMLAGVSPQEVNKRLKSVSGYAGTNKNLIIWQKIHEAIPWLEWEFRGYDYDNNQVKNNLPCLVEVNGAPIGGFRHWVVYVGDQKLADPWDGMIKPTSTYIATGYSIIKRISDPPSGGDNDMGDEALKVCLADREKFWKDLIEMDHDYEDFLDELLILLEG